MTLTWLSLDDLELLKNQTVLIFLRCLKAVPCMRNVRNVPLQAPTLYSQGFSIFSVTLTKMASYYWGGKWHFLLSHVYKFRAYLKLVKEHKHFWKKVTWFWVKILCQGKSRSWAVCTICSYFWSCQDCAFTWQLHTIFFLFFTHFLYLICSKNRSFLQKLADCIQPFVGVNLICALCLFSATFVCSSFWQSPAWFLALYALT